MRRSTLLPLAVLALIPAVARPDGKGGALNRPVFSYDTASEEGGKPMVKAQTHDARGQYAPGGEDFTALVEPRLGTTQTRWIAFSSACRPFGMINASPDTRTDGDWGCGYYYPDREVLGFSHIHEWQIAALLVMPVAGEKVPLSAGPESWKSGFSHDTEIAKPGYHKVELSRYGIEAELTATRRVAVHRYGYSRPDRAGVILDLASPLGPCKMGPAELTRLSAKTFAGYVVNEPTVRRPKPLTVYFHLAFDRPVDMERAGHGEGLRAVARPREAARSLVMKAGFSYTSCTAAKENLESETGDSFDFDAFRAAAREDWNGMLGRVKVEGGTETRRGRFYTDLYFALLGRRTVNDVKGSYIDNTGPEPVVRRIPPGDDGLPRYRHFNSDSFWGAQWTITPLWSLVCPEVVDEFCRCFMDIYRNGGLVPRGPSGGNYTFVMTSAQTTPLFVHALQAGIYRPDDPDEVYAALRKNHFPGGLMSKAGYEHSSARGGGLEDYIKLGYIPEDLPKVGYHMNGAAQTLEHAYNDWCLAQLARSTGRASDAELFARRAKNYLHLFDAKLGMMRPRARDGSWLEPYDPFERRGWTEAGGWNYTFYVPHDVPGLIEAFGSQERFLERLERCLELSATRGFKAPHDKHHETALDFGNEPALAVAHLFHLAGEPPRTQYWVRRILDTLKSGNSPLDGYGGDEDQGMMGAWNALVAMGLFTVDGGCGEEPEFIVTTPAFDRITITVPGRPRPFIIEKRPPGSDEKIYISKAELDGSPLLPRLAVKRRRISAGGTLSLVTSARPD